MRDWTIFKGIASKGGGWVLLQGELEVDGRGGSTFSLVGVTSLPLHISFMVLLHTSFS